MPLEAVLNVTVLSKERVTRRALYLFLGCLICFLTLVCQQPAHAAQPSPTRPGIVIDSDTKFAALPDGQRLQLLIQMIRSGRHRLADRLLKVLFEIGGENSCGFAHERHRESLLAPILPNLGLMLV